MTRDAFLWTLRVLHGYDACMCYQCKWHRTRWDKKRMRRSARRAMKMAVRSGGPL